MKIVVSGEKTIAAVQHEFQEEYPFLKIEFFRADTSVYRSPDKNHFPADKAFRAFTTNLYPDPILIIPTITVAELEEKFKVHYGLTMQIFRKSGKVWLETTLTDNWTLQEQNEQGKSLSSSI